MSMFVFHFMGGLGNQMFQWAAARSLSIRRNIPFVVDFDDPYKFVKRQLGLNAFRLNLRMANRFQLLKIKPKRRIFKRLFLIGGLNPNKHLYKEAKDYHYMDDFFDCPDNSYISGFWQSEKYFSSIESTVRSDFAYRDPPNAANQKYLEEIMQTDSVSVHIRRGDYVNVKKTNSLHGTCSVDYYMEAFDRILKHVKQPAFFFFSDDIPWAKNNFHSLNIEKHFVDINSGKNAHEDLRLMSNCRHNIIANSSFSWWGAWLNNHSQKIVIAPQKWANVEGLDTTDLIPPSWIKL